MDARVLALPTSCVPGNEGYVQGEMSVQEGNKSYKAFICGFIDKDIFRKVNPELYEFVGTWTEEQRFGKPAKVFRALDYFPTVPKTRNAIMDFLTSLAGMTKIRYQKIIDKLGDDAVEAILLSDDALKGIKGINEKTAAKIREQVKEKYSYKEVIARLVAMGFTGVEGLMRKRVMNTFGSETLDILINDPYRLVKVDGIGFKTIDNKLLRAGLTTRDNPNRIAAAHQYVLDLAAGYGHTWQTPDEIHVALAEEKVVIPREELEKYTKMAVDKQMIRPVDGGFALPEIAEAEEYVANYLAHLANQPKGKRVMVHKLKPNGEPVLTDEQLAGLGMSVNHAVSVITGIPGAGKTYLVKEVVGALGDVHLTAPTGKAAKRVAAAAGQKASTIHSFMASYTNYDPKYPPPPIHNLVIDESSMVSVDLLARVLRIVKRHGDHPRLVLVGDPDQLPSIDAGRILGDLVDGGIVPTTKLTQLQRASETSYLAVNAKNIREATRKANGQLVGLEVGPTKDFTVSEVGIFDDALKLLARAYYSNAMIRQTTDPTNPKAKCYRVEYAGGQPIPGKLSQQTKPGSDNSLVPMDLIEDVQILHPQNTQCRALNQVLQELLNPDRGQPKYERTPAPYTLERTETKDTPNPAIPKETFRVGDKVLVTKNLPRGKAVNGDVGRLVNVFYPKPDAPILTLQFDKERKVNFSDKELDHITLAYAMTIHKSQGSEYPMCIVMVDDNVNPELRSRNMLYTAITRGKQKVWAIGTQATFNSCIENTSPDQRRTRLKELLKQQMELYKQAPKHDFVDHLMGKTEEPNARPIPPAPVDEIDLSM